MLAPINWVVVGLHCLFIPLFVLSVPPVIYVALSRTDIAKTTKALFISLIATPLLQILYSVFTIAAQLSKVKVDNHKSNIAQEVFDGITGFLLVILFGLTFYQLSVLLNSLHLVCVAAKTYPQKVHRVFHYSIRVLCVLFTVIELPILFGIWIAYNIVEQKVGGQGQMILQIVTGVIVVTLALYFVVLAILYVIFIVTLIVQIRVNGAMKKRVLLAVLYTTVLAGLTLLVLASLAVSAVASFDIIVYLIGGIMLTVSLLIFVWVVLLMYGSLRSLKIKFDESGQDLTGSNQMEMAYPVEE
jgi:hypothetical protein